MSSGPERFFDKVLVQYRREHRIKYELMDQADRSYGMNALRRLGLVAYPCLGWLQKRIENNDSH
jgi:hypothetical protein